MEQLCLETQQRTEHFTPMLGTNGTEEAAELDVRAIRDRRDLIESMVGQVFGVHSDLLHAMTRGKAEVAHARQVAMYLTHTVLSLNLSDTGRVFDRDRTTVAHACTVIEDMRDDMVFDRVVELLESVVEALMLPRALDPRSH